MADYIEREAARNAILDMHCKSDGDGYVWILFGDAVRRIDNLPSVERKKGKWESYCLSDLTYKYRCSLCKRYHRARYDFCPSCGAEMTDEA